jgi:hypothetical protein
MRQLASCQTRDGGTEDETAGLLPDLGWGKRMRQLASYLTRGGGMEDETSGRLPGQG